MLVWLLVQPVLIERSVSGHFPADMIAADSSLELTMADVRRVAGGIDVALTAGAMKTDASGRITTDLAQVRDTLKAVGVALGSDVTPEVLAAEQEYRQLSALGATGRALLALALALLGMVYAVRVTDKDFRARNRVEIVTLGALMASSTIAILTTVGIIASMLTETFNFFQAYPVADFFFGLTWSPNFKGDSELGILPLIWGTLYISLVSMLVAVPVGLFAAIYLAEYASARARAWIKPLIELIADPRTLVVGLADGAPAVRLTDEQSRAILALTLSRLTGLGRDEIFGEARTLAEAIAGYLEILASREKIMAIVREELVEVREAFAIPRRTIIVEGDADMEDEDLILREDMVITVTHGGYVKRTPLATYRTQRRGGKGRSGMSTKEEDAVTRVFAASTHAPVLFFSSTGKVYKLKVWRLPLGLPSSRGKAFVNLLPLEPNESITSILLLPEDEAQWDGLDVMFATRSGNVRRNRLSDFVQVNRNGKIAMKLDAGDGIVGVGLCTVNHDVLLTTALGQCIRFGVDDVRVFAGRESTGVRGIRLSESDQVISMAILLHLGISAAEQRAYLKYAKAMRAVTGEAVDDAEVAVVDEAETEGAGTEEGEAVLSLEQISALGAQEQFILTLSDTGYGKRSSSFEYRVTGRGGKGLVAHDLSKRGGKVVASFPVEDGDEIVLVTDQGQLIRCPVGEIRIAARNTQGVTIFRTADDERVVSVERLAEGDKGDDDTGSEDGAEP